MAMHNDAGTKQRLLAAGREIFAQRGVKDSTVRDICSMAEANVAAVNYHFGGKEKLFMAVLSDFLEKTQARFPVTLGLGKDALPRERLKAYITSLLMRLVGDGDPVNEKLGVLLTCEMIEPSEHFNTVAERYLIPWHDVLLGILREMLPEADEQTIHLCGAGVVGHCLLFDNAKQLIRRMCPEMALETLGVDLVADFVYNYAMAGITRLAKPAA